MRLAVLSDIHANLSALEAVLMDMQRHDVAGVIVAGDLVGGPQPVETIHLLRSLGSWMIRGNSDNGLLQYDAGDVPDAWRVGHQFALLRWTYRHLDRETLEFIKSLPEQRVVEITGTAAIRVVHGSPRNPSESIFPDRDPAILDLALAQTSEPVLVCGHTHIPWKQERDGRLVLNPGAVCGPLNGHVGSQYALLTWHDNHWLVEHQAVTYGLDQIRAAFRESGLLEEGGALARAFLLCLETGQNVLEDFLSYAYGLAAEAGFKDCKVVPDAIWSDAAATFNWDEAV
ncbi:MAG: YfcE family phosphodiesterase [Chloroflexota bacterium]|nr:YfcE family phosphodiesterase [Chloroflexota bacterium]